MILRETRVSECWCPKCSTGQIGQIHDMLMNNSAKVTDLIGKEIKCNQCGTINILEDVLELVPTSFFVASAKDFSKVKSNTELNNWLNS